ncbi:bacterial proteasome activator family protein [Myceligenerans indicum]|uniref:Bacterial proteasome activator n=1 Tax=Myceligenerans indicum TaxID=2593663 RepID=A0ABS1LIQ7_9MICO|nr:bacterial proteasome activator family protein [Myceligenerans indicum]MBL0886043.1 bacterial proteasome activator family protein [Myceligenerans indicum]
MSHADDTPTAPETGTTAHDEHSQIVTPDGRTISPHSQERPREQEEDTDAEDVVSQVEEPAKVMRIGGMIKRLLDEVRDAPLDDAARTRLAEVHERSIKELEDGLSPDLIDELHRITLPFTEQDPPSDAELRVAHAQLVGWLEGLFHGIQTALVAQQMAAQAQLTGMRRALPPGAHVSPFPPGDEEQADGRHHERGPGQYL